MEQNYFAHGGRELVIGGKVTFLPTATVEGLDALCGTTTPAVANHTEHTVGTPPEVEDSTATTVAALRADYNHLLQTLRAAGILAQVDAL